MHPESSLSKIARPPVQREEADTAEDAICPYHRGQIRAIGANEAQVFWCPIGRQYWRYRKINDNTGFTTRLNYPKSGIV